MLMLFFLFSHKPPHFSEILYYFTRWKEHKRFWLSSGQITLGFPGQLQWDLSQQFKVIQSLSLWLLPISAVKKMMTCQLSAQSNKLIWVCILSELALDAKGVLLQYLLCILWVITMFIPFYRTRMYRPPAAQWADVYMPTTPHLCIL